MATLQIQKKTAKVWLHVPSDGESYIVSKLYIKSEGEQIRIVEQGGSQRASYNVADISVFDIGGSAETFANANDLMQRLEALSYVGFFYDGDAPSKLNKDFSTLPTATTPLLGTETIAINQGGEPKELLLSELGGGSVSINDKFPLKFWNKAAFHTMTTYGDYPLAVGGTNSGETSNNAGIGLDFNTKTSAASAGSQIFFRQANGPRKETTNGGYYKMKFFLDANGSTAFRGIAGIGSPSPIGNVNSSTSTRILSGLMADSADTNYQFMYKPTESSLSAVKIDLGWAKSGKKYFTLEMLHETGSSETTVTIINHTDNDEYTAVLPFEFYGSHKMEFNNGSDAIAVRIGLAIAELNTDDNV